MKTRSLLPLLSLLAVATAVPSLAVAAASDHAADVAGSFERFREADNKFGFLQENCIECHNADDWAGSLAFDLISPNEIADNVAIWERVISKLQGRMMPPAGQPRPDSKTTDEFVAWVEDYLDHAASTQEHAGRVGLHRLNRKEYANSVRDLFGIEVDAATLLPADASVEGFDNVAAALRASPALLDQSLTAARVVVAQAVGNPAPRAGGATYTVSGNQYAHIAGLPLGTRGGLLVEHYFPADGEYVLNIGNLAAALWVTNQEFTHQLIATLDGVKFFEMEIGGGEQLKAIDQLGDPAVDEINSRLKDIKFAATAGPHKLAVTFVHRSYAEFEGTLVQMTPGRASDVVALNSIEVQGPFNPVGLSQTPAREKVFSCYPAAASEEDTCASAIIARIAHLAWRGPVAETDLAKLQSVYASAKTNEGFEFGVRRALTAVLASPKFLYRIESLPAEAAPGSVHSLSELELASRLSFFLWSSIPDAELLALAEAGELGKDAVLAKQVDRMLRDPRAESLATNFATQWLNLAALDDINPDPDLFRDIDRGVRGLFKEELSRLTGDVFLNNKPVTELLTADYSYLNERLALHYGIHSVKGDQFRKVTLADSSRFGLLGKGGILMASSYPDRTSPVLRGKYVLEFLLGTPPPLPPPNVEALIDNKPGQRQMTIRERLAVHRTNPSCSGCHGFIDPLGFALEGFDAVGRSRTVDRFVGAKVDTDGILPDGTAIAGIDDLRTALIARPRVFVENLTHKLMLYALGRPVEAQDMPTVRSIVNGSEKNDYAFYDLVQGIVRSTQFRKVQADLPAPEQAGQAVSVAQSQ
jgi:mono/diheme cytochrome c family protein